MTDRSEFTPIGQLVRTQRVMIQGPRSGSPYWVAFLEGPGVDEGAIGKTAREAVERLRVTYPEVQVDWREVDRAA